jgi:flagellar secretion chaperone FliS
MLKPGFGGANRANPAQTYLMKEVLEATPQMLILKLYDFAITNCQKRDTIKTNNALQELINALRFDDEKAKEISIGLLRLYQFCQDQMRKGNIEIVKRILTELRDTWKDAFSRK